MKLLGLDFDNTLVQYDKLFYQLAIEKNLVEETIQPTKIAIRDYLNLRGQNSQFTLLQGEVYGKRILEAEPALGMLEALKELNQRGIPMVLVSHKTRTPYEGPAYDLHKSASEWLKKFNFFDRTGLNWNDKNIFFEETKEMKIKRIGQLDCKYYVDDLPEILGLISNKTKKILYDPENIHNKNSAYQKANTWELIKQIVGEGQE